MNTILRNFSQTIKLASVLAETGCPRNLCEHVTWQPRGGCVHNCKRREVNAIRCWIQWSEENDK